MNNADHESVKLLTQFFAELTTELNTNQDDDDDSSSPSSNAPQVLLVANLLRAGGNPVMTYVITSEPAPVPSSSPDETKPSRRPTTYFTLRASESITPFTPSSNDVPCVTVSESTLSALLVSKTLSPLVAYAKGLIKVQGDRTIWQRLQVPARNAAKRIFPLLEAKLPFPTFKDLAFLTPESSQWVRDEATSRCQVCSSEFSSLLNRWVFLDD